MNDFHFRTFLLKPLLQMPLMPRILSHDRFLEWQFNNDTWIIACNYKRCITAAITCPREIPQWCRCHTLSGYLPQKWNWNHFHIFELMKVTLYWLNSKSFNSVSLAFMARRLEDERNNFLYSQTVKQNSRFDYNFLNGESNRLLFSTAWMNGNISSFKYIIVYIQDKTSIILIFIFKMFSVFVFIWLIISYQNEFVSFFIYILMKSKNILCNRELDWLCFI